MILFCPIARQKRSVRRVAELLGSDGGRSIASLALELARVGA